MSKPGKWQRPFLAALAETSNIKRAAKAAKVCTSTVYDTRRKNRAFADKWQAALAEGYDNLEIELLRRLREGELEGGKSDKRARRKFDNGVALRLLMAHKEARARQEATRANVSAAEVRASIERKVEILRLRVIERREAETEAGGGEDGA